MLCKTKTLALAMRGAKPMGCGPRCTGSDASTAFDSRPSRCIWSACRWSPPMSRCRTPSTSTPVTRFQQLRQVVDMIAMSSRVRPATTIKSHSARYHYWQAKRTAMDSRTTATLAFAVAAPVPTNRTCGNINRKYNLEEPHTQLQRCRV